MKEEEEERMLINEETKLMEKISRSKEAKWKSLRKLNKRRVCSNYTQLERKRAEQKKSIKRKQSGTKEELN